MGILAVFLAGFWLHGFPQEKPQETRNEPSQEIASLVEEFTNQMISGETRKDQEIEIENDPVPEPTSQQELCEGKEHTSFSCYEVHFRTIVRNEGIAASFQELKALYATNDYVRSQCHPITHVVGAEAVSKFATVAKAYKEGDSFCWSGYYHGVLEGIMGKVGYSDLAQEMNTICASLAQERQYSFDHYNCVHGLGHGVMAVSQNELFASLEMCDVLGDTWERTSCWSGAFMENIIVDSKNHFTKYLKPSDPLYPCNAVASQYKNICYLMQTSYMLKLKNGDFVTVFELCKGADQGFQETCYQSVGRDASGRSLSNAVRTKATCGLGKDFIQQSNCIVGAVKDFISYYHSDVQAKELCASLDTEELRTVCGSTAETYAKIL